jgi:hypothetical protein
MALKGKRNMKAHMEKMRQAKALRAAANIAADNEDGIKVDGDDGVVRYKPVKTAPPRTAVIKKKPPAKSLKKRVPPRVEPPAPVAAKSKAAPIPRRDLKGRSLIQGRATRDSVISRDAVTGRVVVERDGKIYTRRVTQSGDKFHIDKIDIPEGMSYQWIAVTVVGAEQRNSLAGFVQNGWTAVPMSRYPGRYGPEKENGPILIDGLMLHERPEELTEEAINEGIKASRDLIKTRNDQFTPKLPGALSPRHRGTGLRASRSIEGMPPDVGRPTYEMDVDDGLVA